MNSRASFREQDAGVTASETTVQIRSARSMLKHLDVRPVPAASIADLIAHEHYLHSMPAAACICFAIYHDSTLLGAVVFTAGARHSYRILQAARPQEVVTLARLWLSDLCPKNSESRVIGVVLRHLRRQSHWKLLLSYADPSAGHVGTIYQATGWLYLGQGVASSYLDMGDGRLQHPRSVYEQYGSNATPPNAPPCSQPLPISSASAATMAPASMPSSNARPVRNLRSINCSGTRKESSRL